MYGEFSVWKGLLTETHGQAADRRASLAGLARGQRGSPRGREAGAQDALYGDEKPRRDAELTLGKRQLI